MTDLPRLLFAIVAVGLFIWLLLWAARRQMFAFEIRIEAGRPRLIHGKPRLGFLAEVQEIAERNAIANGTIRGVGSGRGMRLSFSGPISRAAQQQMRNAWGLLR